MAALEIPVTYTRVQSTWVRSPRSSKIARTKPTSSTRAHSAVPQHAPAFQMWTRVGNGPVPSGWTTRKPSRSATGSSASQS